MNTKRNYSLMIRAHIQALLTLAVETPSDVADIFFDFSPHCDAVSLYAYLGGWDRARMDDERHRLRDFDLDLHIDMPDAAEKFAAGLAQLEAFVEVAADLAAKREVEEPLKAAAEREAFGAAVTAHREAKEYFLATGEGEETVKMRAVVCAHLMEEMKFERRGIWWDEKHGTWGIGEAPWREDEEMPEHATCSGPHS